MIQVKNLTFTYSAREDRIILTLNHDEPQNRIDFLVTRKKLLDLLNGFDHILIHHCDNGSYFKELYHAQEPLMVQNEKSSKQTSQKKWEKAVNTNELNLTKIKEPFLLDTLSFVLKGGVFYFKFFHLNELKAVASMSSMEFQQTLSSLMRVIPFVDWGISPHILD